MNKTSLSLGVIILAAGASTRLGTPKQLLAWRGETLLQRTIRNLTEISLPKGAEKSIVVVLGASAGIVAESIRGSNVTVVQNTEWESGMASSVRAGVNELHRTSSCNAALITLCDQPLVTTADFTRLLALHDQSPAGITACSYSGATGVPAIFDQQYFSALCSLQGDRGARSLFNQFAHDVVLLDCPQAAVDIDTMEDYRRELG